MNIPKGKTLVLIILITLILIALAVLSLRGKSGMPEKTPIPSVLNLPIDDKNEIKDPVVVQITPPSNSVINAGAKQTFNIAFSQNINLNSLIVALKSQEFGASEGYQNVEFSKNVSGNNLILTLSNPTLPSSKYNLVIYTSQGVKLLQTTYASSREQNQAENNNPELSAFLPHKTNSYALNYVPDRGIYVFSFNFNTYSTDSSEVQYENAKKDAEDFIKSHGIDPNSIEIEWRYH